MPRQTAPASKNSNHGERVVNRHRDSPVWQGPKLTANSGQLKDSGQLNSRTQLYSKAHKSSDMAWGIHFEHSRPPGLDQK